MMQTEERVTAGAGKEEAPTRTARGETKQLAHSLRARAARIKPAQTSGREASRNSKSHQNGALLLAAAADEHANSNYRLTHARDVLSTGLDEEADAVSGRERTRVEGEAKNKGTLQRVLCAQPSRLFAPARISQRAWPDRQSSANEDLSQRRRRSAPRMLHRLSRASQPLILRVVLSRFQLSLVCSFRLSLQREIEPVEASATDWMARAMTTDTRPYSEEIKETLGEVGHKIKESVHKVEDRLLSKFKGARREAGSREQVKESSEKVESSIAEQSRQPSVAPTPPTSTSSLRDRASETMRHGEQTSMSEIEPILGRTHSYPVRVSGATEPKLPQAASEDEQVASQKAQMQDTKEVAEKLTGVEKLKMEALTMPEVSGQTGGAAAVRPSLLVGSHCCLDSVCLCAVSTPAVDPWPPWSFGHVERDCGQDQARAAHGTIRRRG